MRKIKTIFISLLLVITTFSLTGCGGGEADYTLEDVQAGNSNIVFLSRSSFIVEKTATPIVDLEVRSTNPVTLSLISGNDLFSIDQNNSCIVYAENISGANLTKSDYTVIVQAKDNNGKTVNQIISLEFVDDLDAVKPQIDLTFSTQPFVVAGDTNPFITIEVYDVRGYGITYSLEGPGSGMFTITGAGALSLKANTPVGVYDVIVVATDNDKSSLISKTSTITVSVVGSEADLKPTIISNTFLYTENDTNAMQIEASTTTSEALVFTLGDISDSGRFTLSSTGALTFKVAPDHEKPLDNDSNNVYGVEVIATDVNGQTDTKTVMVTVLNIDDGVPGMGYTSLQYWYDGFGTDEWRSESRSLTSLNEDTNYRLTLVSSPQVNGDTVTYTLQNIIDSEGGVFQLQGDVLYINAPNIAWNATYTGSVEVVAHDTHGNSSIYLISIKAD